MTIADVAVSSSRQEGLPINVMEAMATGLPSSLPTAGATRDLVKIGKMGL